MIAHFNIDYTFYFEKEDLEKLVARQELQSELQGYREKYPVTVSLKEKREMSILYDNLKRKSKEVRREKKIQCDFLVFENEAQLAIVHWNGDHHFLYFQKTWFAEVVEKMIIGTFSSRTIRWGAEKITILAGNDLEARMFKINWGPLPP